jgi:hypothetical protein
MMGPVSSMPLATFLNRGNLPTLSEQSAGICDYWRDLKSLRLIKRNPFLAVPREVGLAIKALGLCADINSLLLKLDKDWAPTSQVIAGGHQPWLDAARAGCPPSCHRQWPGPRIQPGQVARWPAGQPCFALLYGIGQARGYCLETFLWHLE